jgi:hypothetical protein
LELLRAEKFMGTIWECACGRGNISKILIAKGHTVISTDLMNHGYGRHGVDFLRQWKMPGDAMNIISNPPFRLADDFIAHALSLKPAKLAFLLRIQALEGVRRGGIFKRHPPARVHVFSQRLQIFRPNYKGSGTGMQAFAWFVWLKGHFGPSTIHWL